MSHSLSTHYPIWHPFSTIHENELPIKIIRGKKTCIYDDNNNVYIDAISSWWVTIHGHGQPQIAKAIYQQAKQLEQVIFANFVHEPALALSQTILSLFQNHFSKVFFSDNGSTAVEVGMKMALQFWTNCNQQRRKVLTLQHAYHGDTFGTMSVGARSLFSKPFDDFLFDVESIDLADENVIKNLETKNLNEYAFFIYEPLVQGAGGMKMYDEKKLDKVLKLLRQHQVILIADEVMTGWGRTGRLFASDYLETRADIICLSKGLTGGFLPLGLTLCTHNIYDSFKSTGKTFYHGHSFTANPISCACANASIELLLNAKTQKSINSISQQHKAFVHQLKKIPNIFNARSKGTIVAFEWKTENAAYNLFDAKKITDYFLKCGIFLRPLGNTIYVMPPYCISKKELRHVYTHLITFIKSF